MAGLRRIERRDWCHAVGDTVVVDQRGIERIGQREASKRQASQIVDRGSAADDVVAIDQQNQREIDAVPMDAFRSRVARRLRSCLERIVDA